MKSLNNIWVFLLIISIKVCSQGPKNEYHKGIVNINKQLYTEAIENFTNVLKEEPSDYMALLYRGIALTETGEYQQALIDLTGANKKRKDIASFALAQLFAMQDDAEKSIFYLEQHLNSRYKLPENEIRLNEKFRKIQQNERWVELWKNEWYSSREKAVQEIKYLNKSDDYFEALEMADETIKKYKKTHELYAARAEIYKNLNNPKAVIANYDKAIDNNKRIDTYYIKRGKDYLEMGKYNNALSDFDKALKLSDDNFELYLEKALVLNGLKKYSQALKEVRSYLVLVPDDVKALRICGEIYFNDGRYTEAIECFTKVIQYKPGEASGYLSRGEGFYNNKNYRKAYEDYTMALDLDPSNPLVYLQRGYARLRLGQYKGACYDWEKAGEMGSLDAKKKKEEFCE